MLNESLLMLLLEIRNYENSIVERTEKIIAAKQTHPELSEGEFLYYVELSSLVLDKLLEIRYSSNGNYEKLVDELKIRGIDLPAPVLGHLKAWDQAKYQEWVRNR